MIRNHSPPMVKKNTIFYFLLGIANVLSAMDPVELRASIYRSYLKLYASIKNSASHETIKNNAHAFKEFKENPYFQEYVQLLKKKTNEDYCQQIVEIRDLRSEQLNYVAIGVATSLITFGFLYKSFQSRHTIMKYASGVGVYLVVRIGYNIEQNAQKIESLERAVYSDKKKLIDELFEYLEKNDLD